MHPNGLHSKLCNIGGEHVGGGVVNVNSHTDWATEHQNQTKNKTV